MLSVPKSNQLLINKYDDQIAGHPRPVRCKMSPSARKLLSFPTAAAQLSPGDYRTDTSFFDVSRSRVSREVNYDVTRANALTRTASSLTSRFGEQSRTASDGALVGCSTRANNNIPNPLSPGEYEITHVHAYKTHVHTPSYSVDKATEHPMEVRYRKQQACKPGPGTYSAFSEFDGRTPGKNGWAGYKLPEPAKGSKKCARKSEFSHLFKVTQHQRVQ